MKTNIRRVLATAGIGMMMAIGMAGAWAQTAAAAPVTVTQNVTCSGNSRVASAPGLSLPALVFSQQSQTATGVLTLTASDQTCSGQGWTVTMQLGGVAYNGNGHPAAANSIAAALGTPGAPALVSGQPVVQHGGPFAKGGGSLDTPRAVMDAKVGFGMGSYQAAIPITLTLPPRTVAGTYTVALTITMSAGPSA